MNRLIDWPGDTKYKGQQNMQNKIKNFLLFFSKMHFLNKCFVFNLSQGGKGFNKEERAHYITR